jgi:prepilin-type N-terminal cleavage/methylation domain-containing protein
MKRNRQAGFSLIELMAAVAIMMIIMGTVFQQMSTVQKRSRTEEIKLDTFQTAREFIDQMTRDIHQAGFPNGKMYGAAFQDPGRDSNAVGIFFISPTEIHFQGDVDGDGIVDYVSYKLFPRSNNPGDENCPCLRRSQLLKQPMILASPYQPWTQAPQFRTQVENITFRPPGGGAFDPTNISNVVIFRAFDKFGNEVPNPGPLPATGLQRTTFDPLDDGWSTDPAHPSDPSGITRIWTVQINLDVQAPLADIGSQGYERPEVFLTATAQVTN